MKYTVLTLFPEMIENAFHTSILDRGNKNGAISLKTVQIRDYSTDKHRRVDDYTYGGGAGMLMQAQPVFDAWKAATDGKKVRTIYLTPQGRPFSQRIARDLAYEEELVLLCGHYEGIDERVLDEIVTDRISIGDYVLTGGELGALVIMDAVSRLVPGVLGNETSADMESFHGSLLEYPQYSRPEVWHDRCVPEVLLSGNRKNIDRWRMEQSIICTQNVRPDLYEEYQHKAAILERLKKKKKETIAIVEAITVYEGEIVFENNSVLAVYDPLHCIGYLYFFDDSKIDSCIMDVIDQFPSRMLTFESNRSLIDQIPEFTEYYGSIWNCTSVKKRFVYTENIPLNIKSWRKEEICENVFGDKKQQTSLNQEISMINNTLQQGLRPYISVAYDNEVDIHLQELLGLYASNEMVYCYERI